MTPSQKKHLSEAMKASHARRKAAAKAVVDIPLDTMPVPPPPARRAVARVGVRPDRSDVDALAQIAVAIFIEWKKRGGR